MLQIKKLHKPSKKSGIKLNPGRIHVDHVFGVKIENTGCKSFYVDEVNYKKYPKYAKKK